MDCWFYAPLIAAKRSRLADTLHAVLEQNADHLPAILAALHRNGTLGRALDALDEPARQWAWTLLCGGPTFDESALHSLMAGVMRLVERLELWKAAPPSLETLVSSYVATRPFAPDWRDPRSLTSSMVAILRFLLARGYLRSAPKEVGGTERTWLDDQAPENLAATDTAGGPPPAPPAFLRQLNQALTRARLARSHSLAVSNPAVAVHHADRGASPGGPATSNYPRPDAAPATASSRHPGRVAQHPNLSTAKLFQRA